VLDTAKARLSAAEIEINERAGNLSVSDPWGTGLGIVLDA
jgi:hypothetical protein